MQQLKIVKTSRKKVISIYALVIFLVILSFILGYYKFKLDIYDAKGGEELLVKKLLIAKSDLKEIKKEKYQFEQKLLFEKKSYAELKSSIKLLKQENDQLQSELALYKSIVDPESSDLGVTLYKFHLYPYNKQVSGLQYNSKKQNLYQGKIILVNRAVHKRFLRGQAVISLTDSQNKSLEDFLLYNEKAQPLAKNQIKIGFKNYQKTIFYLLIDKQYSFTKLNVKISSDKKRFDPIVVDININEQKEYNYVER